MEVLVPITPGEWLDKVSILLLKIDRMPEASDKAMALVQLQALMSTGKELCDMFSFSTGSGKLYELFVDLYDTNGQLWGLEIEVRKDVKDGDKAILIAEIHRKNERRANIKNRIDTAIGSPFKEAKDYADPADF